MTRQAGFSYIWLLLLVAMLGFGLVKAAEVTSQATQRDQERALRAIGNEFRQAIGSYYEATLVDGSHQYPQTLEALLRDDRFPGIRRHLRKIYADPITGKAEWGWVQLNGRIVGVHSLSNKPALKRQGFHPNDQSFIGRARLNEWVFVYPPEIVEQHKILTGGANASGEQGPQ